MLWLSIKVTIMVVVQYQNLTKIQYLMNMFIRVFRYGGCSAAVFDLRGVKGT